MSVFTASAKITQKYLLGKTKTELARMYLDLCDENQRLNNWVQDLQSGMFINCVYCGHRYGPDPGTPVAMADVLKEHIKVCPKHPCSALTRVLKLFRESVGAALSQSPGYTGIGWQDLVQQANEVLK